MRLSVIIDLVVALSILALISCEGLSPTPTETQLTSTTPFATPAAPNELATTVTRLEATIATLSATTLSPTPSPTPSDATAPAQESVPTLFAGSLIGRVTRVIDGDTVEVSFVNGYSRLGLDSTETVRFLGVDTPETHATNKSGEYGNITDTGCLDRWGDLATEFAVETLGQQIVELVLDSDAGLRGFYGRLLAYVQVGDLDFNARLVELGYARVYEEGSSRREAKYLSLQQEARARRIGLWECETSSISTSPSTTVIAPTTNRGTEMPGANCDAAYPTVCIPPPPPDLDCGEISFTNFTVLSPDPHRFDGDKDGVGCET